MKSSTVVWTGKKVTGEHVAELFNLKMDISMVEDGKLVGGEFTIDMTSLKNTDLEGESKQKLEGHLKSEDFFGIEKYPNF